jgi:translation initiation factor IF-2
MGQMSWWVCDECKSLNDLPAKKCYKCRAAKPSNARVVNPVADLGTGQPKRVGVSVKLSDVGDLSSPDPKERQAGTGGVFEAYGAQDDQPIESLRPAAEPSSRPPALREPPKRGIGEAGGVHWELGLVDMPRPGPSTAPGDSASEPRPTEGAAGGIATPAARSQPGPAPAAGAPMRSGSMSARTTAPGSPMPGAPVAGPPPRGGPTPGGPMAQGGSRGLGLMPPGGRQGPGASMTAGGAGPGPAPPGGPVPPGVPMPPGSPMPPGVPTPPGGPIPAGGPTPQRPGGPMPQGFGGPTPQGPGGPTPQGPGPMPTGQPMPDGPTAQGRPMPPGGSMPAPGSPMARPGSMPPGGPMPGGAAPPPGQPMAPQGGIGTGGSTDAPPTAEGTPSREAPGTTDDADQGGRSTS